jgi:uncharacterized membrane protein HdeD (DUF308 family)
LPSSWWRSCWCSCCSASSSCSRGTRRVLPVWGTGIYLLLASLGRNSHALWTIAPWLLTIAATRFGGIFLACSLICACVYAFAKGDHRQKWESMQGVMGILVAGVLIYAPIMLYKAFH